MNDRPGLVFAGVIVGVVLVQLSLMMVEPQLLDGNAGKVIAVLVTTLLLPTVLLLVASQPAVLDWLRRLFRRSESQRPTDGRVPTGPATVCQRQFLTTRHTIHGGDK